MKICEFDFSRQDPKKPDYADFEIDFYAWISSGKGQNHRLSLRRNLKTDEYEVYRTYSFEESEQVIFRGTLEDAIHITNVEVGQFHLGNSPDELCDHSFHSRDKANIFPMDEFQHQSLTDSEKRYDVRIVNTEEEIIELASKGWECQAIGAGKWLMRKKS